MLYLVTGALALNSALYRSTVPTRVHMPQPITMLAQAAAENALPDGIATIDELTPEKLRSFSEAELAMVTDAMEIAIFRAPPFEKPNEASRRKNLSMAYFLQGRYPSVCPNAKEALYAVRGQDAEMHYILGASLLKCMAAKEGYIQAISEFKAALELDPDYQDAKDALAEAEDGLANYEKDGAAASNETEEIAAGGLTVAQACAFFAANPSIDAAEKKAFLVAQGVSEFVIAQAECTATGMESTVHGHPGEEDDETVGVVVSTPEVAAASASIAAESLPPAGFVWGATY